MEESLKHLLSKKEPDTRVHSLWLCLCRVQKHTKPICNNESGGGETDRIVAQKDFWGDGNVLYLGCGGGYMGMYICQNLIKRKF